MKFYIASRLENYRQVRSLAKLLINSGWIQTYDWTSQDLVKDTNIELLKHIGEEE